MNKVRVVKLQRAAQLSNGWISQPNPGTSVSPGTGKSLKFLRSPTMRRVAAVILASLSLIGCYVANQKQFDSYATALVHPVMALSTAELALTPAGFVCDARSSYPKITCTRMRSSFLSGCIERINLTLDDARMSVTGVEPKHIVCTGM